MSSKNISNELINNQKIKLYSIISIWLIILALIGIISASKSTYYEISIFDAYNTFVWIFLFLALTIGLFMAVNLHKKTWRIFGILVTFYINFLFLLLPLLRNYYLYGRSDVITHLAYINEIISTNSFGMINYYPISHLIVVNLHFFTGLSINTIMNFIPALFYILYFIGLYLFTKEITSKVSEVLLVLVFGTVLLFSYYGTMFLPTQLSFAIVPLFLFLLFRSKNDKKNRLKYSLLFVIFIFLMPFLHPLTSINLIITFLLISISLYFDFQKWDKLPINYKNLLNPLVLLAVSFFTWISSKTIFDRNVTKTYNWLVNEVGTPTIDNYKDSLVSSSLGLGEVIKRFFLTYGHEIIFVLISLVAIGFAIREVSIKRKLEYKTNFLILGFVSFTILSIVFFLGSYGLNNPLREFVYVLFFCTLINGIFFSKIISRSSEKRKKNIRFFLVLLILICSIIGLYSSYLSVSVGETNYQVTKTEFIGAKWFFSNKNPEIWRTYDIDKSTKRFSDVYNGIGFTKEKYWMYKVAPYHFNFTNQSGYLILNEYTTQRYGTFWPDNPYYSKEELNSLQNNQLLNRIYDNSDTQIWAINET